LHPCLAMSPTLQPPMATRIPTFDPSQNQCTNWSAVANKLVVPSVDAHTTWATYAAVLYSTSRDDHPRLSISEVDLVYVHPTSITHAAPQQPSAHHTLARPPRCPKAGAPYLGRVVHAPREVVWFHNFSRQHSPLVDHAWAEVTHCGGGWRTGPERLANWFYVARGSGLFVNVGRTLVLRRHQDAVERFLNTTCKSCNGQGCLPDCAKQLAHLLSSGMVQRAGFESLQFVGHCDMRCNLCGHELVIPGSMGHDACSPKIQYRRGIDASLPCTCVPSSLLTSERGPCAWCNESTHPRLALAPNQAVDKTSADESKCFYHGPW
jgi:hypothetical protein